MTGQHRDVGAIDKRDDGYRRYDFGIAEALLVWRVHAPAKVHGGILRMRIS
jgi:hypothetical protein